MHAHAHIRTHTCSYKKSSTAKPQNFDGGNCRPSHQAHDNLRSLASP